MEIKLPLKGHKLLHFPVFKVESRNPSPDLISLLIYLLLLLEPWKSESLPNSISFPLKTLPNISFSLLISLPLLPIEAASPSPSELLLFPVSEQLALVLQMKELSMISSFRSRLLYPLPINWTVGISPAFGDR